MVVTVNRLVNLVFERRHMTPQDYLDLERPVAGELSGMDEVVGALREVFGAASATSTIVVVPDFDMDGIMSGTLLTAGLSELGFPVELFVPDAGCGYGFSSEEAERLVEEHPHARWAITCDVGISAAGGVAALVEHGIRTIVTDHHMESAETTSRDEAWAVVDPCGINETFELPGICGAHVAWRVLMAYAAVYGTPGQRDHINHLRVLAGIGTVSDCMPMVRDNRQLVREAVALLRLVWANPDPWFSETVSGSAAYVGVFRGLSYVLTAVGEHIASADDIDENFVAFTLAPLFNAAKRMNVDMGHAFNVFFGTDESRTQGVATLMAANAERKRLVTELMAGIAEHPSPYAPYLYVVDALPGLVGLVASKLVEQTGTPTLVVRMLDDGSLAGSGRSPEWYPFIDRSRELGIRAAGHNGAFGVRFSSLDEATRQLSALDADVRATLASGEVEVGPVADVVISAGEDGDVGFDVPLLLEFVTLMDGYRPFGKAWPEPRVLVHARAHEYQMAAIGKDRQHLAITCLNGLKCLCWNEADRLDAYVNSSGTGVRDVFVRGTLSINEFRGTVSVQLMGTVDERVGA